mgnify:FL=1
MHPNPLRHPRLSGTGYVPYFYQIGLHYLYLSPEDRRLRQPEQSPLEQLLPSNDAAIRRRLDHPQTVEQIIAGGYFAMPTSEPEFAILRDKAHTSWLGLDDVITQVRQRYEIYSQIMLQLDYAICASINAIYHHEAYVGPGSASSKQHYAKHKAIQEAYEQKRMERVNLWKDVSRLKLSLPEVAQMYLAAHRKEAILKTLPGDAA